MPITRHHSGAWYYQFDRVINGRRTRANRLLPEGTTRAQALDFDRRETARLFQLATGGDKPEPLIADAVLEYLQHHAPNLKNRDDIEAALEILEPFYNGRKMSELAEVAAEYMKVTTVKPATTKNRLAYLRAACRWAWKKKGMGEHDPAERMILPTVKNARHFYLTREQALRVFRRMGLSWSRDAARVAFYTGWRISMVLSAVPMETHSGLFLYIPDSKNDDPQMVPVHQKIEHIVRRHWPPQVTKWTVSKEVKAALRAEGLGHARLHDLRHSAASEMINNDVDLYTVGKVLGHKSAVSTARYAHLAAGKLAAAVAQIGARNSHPDQKKRAA
ncbi:tyrosine-type recombinase/integrase [Hydrogenophaga laconesensis]|uniref:Integrase n=1 Tax=Hydrogenophaga laconesensis TaxID=1805971 RepID=A0ABU1V4A7_9BURK|nr:tyrosine-type recombinase/integrase [Hydrogenophaga laconesensis]MDR7092291.1 integrase [Hydrogenophaga laconesensis]